MGTWDVRAQPVVALDIDDGEYESEKRRLSGVGETRRRLFEGGEKKRRLFEGGDAAAPASQDYCVSPAPFGFFLALAASSTVALTVILVRIGWAGKNV